jgi:hypothetical protein
LEVWPANTILTTQYTFLRAHIPGFLFLRSLLVLLAKDYVYLVGMPLAVPVPLIWWAMHNWLATFEYRIDIGPGAFIIPVQRCYLSHCSPSATRP